MPICRATWTIIEEVISFSFFLFGIIEEVSFNLPWPFQSSNACRQREHASYTRKKRKEKTHC